MNSRLTVGAHILCFINGSFFGHVTQISWESVTPHNAKAGLDSLIPYELIPVQAVVSGKISVLKQGRDGGLEGRGITAPFRHLAQERYFSILIVDRKTGQRLHRADHCKVTDQSWSYAAKDRVHGSFGFRGISWEGEAEYA